MIRILFLLLVLFASDVSALTFVLSASGNPHNAQTYSTLAACWTDVLGGINDHGCASQPVVDESTTITYILTKPHYSSSSCTTIAKDRCFWSRSDGFCQSTGVTEFAYNVLAPGYLVMGFPSCPSGTSECLDAYNAGDVVCGITESTWNHCLYHVNSVKTLLVSNGKSCYIGVETAQACQDTLSDICAEKCEQYGYDSDGCPEDACTTDPEGLTCLNQCSFHNWEDCPDFGTSSSSSSSSSSTSTSSGSSSSSASSSSSSTSTSTSSGSSGGGSGGSGYSPGSGDASANCNAPPSCTSGDLDDVTCAVLLQQWYSMCYLQASDIDVDTSGDIYQPVESQSIDISQGGDLVSGIVNQTSDYSDSCPASEVVDLSFTSFVFSYQNMCDLASALKPFVIAAATVLCFVILFRAILGA
jgi:hypothetical protein